MSSHDDIREALAAATPGPWQVYESMQGATPVPASAVEWCYTCLLPYPCPTVRALDDGES